MGFIALGLCIVAFPALLRGTNALAKARTARKLYDLSAFKDIHFVIYTVGSFIIFLGYIIPYFYIPTYAHSVLGVSPKLSLYILAISISGSFLGRLSVGVVAHWFGPTLTWFCCAAISGTICISWIAVSSQAGLITFAVFWGFCSAGLVTLPAAVFPSLCPDPRRLGTRLGMTFGISSFASLTGSPIAGALLKSRSGVVLQPRSVFLGPQLFGGCCLLVGGLIICLLWVLNIRKLKRGVFV
jgi:MFS family permease